MRGYGEPTFCLDCVPAPGHSVMMSSFASVFVANANATPEKVVPYCQSMSVEFKVMVLPNADKIYANDELRFASSGAFDFRYGWSTVLA